MTHCKHCAKTPGLHTFSYKNTDKDGNKVFYSCPGRAGYTEMNDGVSKLMEHIDGALQGCDSGWVWIFDGSDFGMGNAMQLRTAYALCKRLNSDKRLRRIDVINPTWHIHSMLTFLHPIMSEDMRKKTRLV